MYFGHLLIALKVLPREPKINQLNLGVRFCRRKDKVFKFNIAMHDIGVVQVPVEVHRSPIIANTQNSDPMHAHLARAIYSLLS